MTVVVRSDTRSVIAPSGPASTPGSKGDPGSPGEGYANRGLMAARAAPALLDDVHLNENGREGKFVVDAASSWTAAIAADTAQGIFVVSTADGTKVYRRVGFETLNPAWFGAVLDWNETAGTGTNDSAAMLAAIALSKALAGNDRAGFYRGGPAIRIPFGKFLNMGTTPIDVTHVFQLLGWGSGYMNAAAVSGIRWADGTTGIRIQNVDTSGDSTIDGATHLAAGIFTIRGLKLSGGYAGTESNSHCIDPKAPFNFDDIWIDNWSGEGINGLGNIGTNHRNISNSSLTRFRISNCRIGFYPRGPDANIIRIGSGWFNVNRQAGYIDDSGIGANSLDGIHFAANGGGLIPNMASSGGHRYALKWGGNSANAPSGTTADTADWLHVEVGGVSGSTIPAWSAVTTFRAGGDVLVVNDIAVVTLDGCYFEEGILSQFGANTVLINPVLAVRYMRGGVVIRSSGGIFDVSTGGAFAGSLTATGLNHVFGPTTGSPSVVVDVAYGTGGDGKIRFRRPGVADDGILWAFANTLLIDGSGTLNFRISGTSVVGLTSAHFAPITDNVTKLGDAAQRWSQLYAGTATINTSDKRTKSDIAAPSDKLLDAWAEVNWQSFKFKDAVKAKGKDGARLHVGLVAQTVRDIFKKHDIDGFALGLLCHDEWEDLHEPATKIEEYVEEYRIEDLTKPDGYRLERRKAVREIPEIDKNGNQVMRRLLSAGDRFGIRYEEALALEAAYQRRRADRIEKRLVAIETKTAK